MCVSRAIVYMEMPKKKRRKDSVISFQGVLVGSLGSNLGSTSTGCSRARGERGTQRKATRWRSDARQTKDSVVQRQHVRPHGCRPLQSYAGVRTQGQQRVCCSARIARRAHLERRRLEYRLGLGLVIAVLRIVRLELHVRPPTRHRVRMSQTVCRLSSSNPPSPGCLGGIRRTSPGGVGGGGWGEEEEHEGCELGVRWTHARTHARTQGRSVPRARNARKRHRPKGSKEKADVLK